MRPRPSAANDLRIRIPATLTTTWNTALTTATITGSGAGKVSPTVSYADAGKTLVLNVTSNFVGSDQLVVSGLQYTSFTAPSASDYLQLVVFGPAASTARAIAVRSRSCSPRSRRLRTRSSWPDRRPRR